MQKDTHKISIVIPVYNVERYLRQCLDSIVNQSFSDFEVICINDGSTDNSLESLNEYASKDKRFIVLSQENQGLSVARIKRSFLEQIFSLKNKYKDAIKYKIVTVLGIKFYIKPKKRKEMI